MAPEPPFRAQDDNDMPILVPVSWGELLDKITILDIKNRRIGDADKLANVRRELDALNAVAVSYGPFPAGTGALIEELKAINEQLWDIEDRLRDCERDKDFGDRFVQLARGVYHSNDRRAELKKRLNALLGSELVEEKSYQPY